MCSERLTVLSIHWRASGWVKLFGFLLPLLPIASVQNFCFLASHCVQFSTQFFDCEVDAGEPSILNVGYYCCVWPLEGWADADQILCFPASAALPLGSVSC